MNTILKSNEQKGLFFSFLLHGVVVFFYFFYFYHELQSKETEKCVMMTIENLCEQQVQPEQMQQKTPPPVQQEQQHIEKVVEKPIKPIEPQPIIEEPQPIVKKEEPIQPIEKVSEPIKPIQKLIEPTPIQKQVEAPQPQSIEKSTPPPTPAKPTPVISKTDFGIIRDKVLKNLVYPSIAKRMNWQGVVHIAIKIDENGKFISAHIHTSSGRIQLDEAALRAAYELKNQSLPKSANGTTIILPINFRLT